MSSGPAGLVQLVPTCQVSLVNPTPCSLSSLTLRLFPAWCSLCLQQCLGAPCCSYTAFEVTQWVTAHGHAAVGGVSVPWGLWLPWAAQEHPKCASQIWGLAVLTTIAPGACARRAVAQQGAVAALCNNRSQFAHAQRWCHYQTQDYWVLWLEKNTPNS